jgi:hypothetical protein
MSFERQQPLTVWTIAAGVAIGIITADIIEWGSAAVYVNYEAAKATAAMREAEERQQKEAQQRQRANEERERALRHADAIKERQEYATRQAEIDAKARKDEAWAAYYKRPAKCDDNPDTATFTQCANDAIRARTTFEATYTP